MDQATLKTQQMFNADKSCNKMYRLRRLINQYECVHYFKVRFLYNSVYIGARCSSVVRAFVHGAMGRRIDPSWCGPTELFLVPASALFNSVHSALCLGMCYPVYGMVHIKEPLLLIGKINPCGDSGFSLSLTI